jgi:hypothetical protein
VNEVNPEEACALRLAVPPATSAADKLKLLMLWGTAVTVLPPPPQAANEAAAIKAKAVPCQLLKDWFVRFMSVAPNVVA